VFITNEQYLYASFSDTTWDTKFLELWNSDNHKKFITEEDPVMPYSEYLQEKEEEKKLKVFRGKPKKKSLLKTYAPQKKKTSKKEKDGKDSRVPNPRHSFKNYFRHRYNATTLVKNFRILKQIEEENQNFRAGNLTQMEFLESLIFHAQNAKDLLQAFRIVNSEGKRRESERYGGWRSLERRLVEAGEG
jgi:hypothetical protein